MINLRGQRIVRWKLCLCSLAVRPGCGDFGLGCCGKREAMWGSQTLSEHWFSVASVTTYHELGGLRQLCLITSAFCREKSSLGLPRGKSGLGRALFLEAVGEVSFLCLSVPRGCRAPRRLAPFLPVKASVGWEGLLTLCHSDFFPLTLFCLLPLFKKL